MLLQVIRRKRRRRFKKQPGNTIKYNPLNLPEEMMMQEPSITDPIITPEVFAFPLSYAQQRLWVLEQMDQVGSAFNIYGAFHVTGALNISVLEQTLQCLVDRHEIFRTTFDTMDGQARQIIIPALTATIDLEDISDVPLQQERIQMICKEEATFRFDLTTGPLFKIKIIQCGKDACVLSFCFHHIISDGWSVGVFARELRIVYQALMNGDAPLLEELPLQYADYAIWQRQQFEDGQLQIELDYWKHQLQQAPDRIHLLLDKPRPHTQTFNGDSCTFYINAHQTQQLKLLAAEQGATLYMTLLSIFSILLSKYSQQKDLLIGSVIANRNNQELESLIGYFINTLVMRLDLEGTPSFITYLEKVRTVTLDAYDHQNVPFEQLLEELKVQRDASHSPLFQVMFVLQQAATGEAQTFSGLTLTPLPIENATAKYDLTLGISPEGQQLQAVFQFNTDLFEREHILRMSAHFSQLIDQVLAAPEQCIHAYSILTVAERKQVLVDWNRTEQAIPTDTVMAMIGQFKDTIALDHNGQQMTYAVLQEQSNRIAHFIVSQGLAAGSIVAVCLERSSQLIVTMLGILKSGCAYLAIDPDYPEERKRYMISDSGAAMLLTDALLEPAFRDMDVNVQQVNHIESSLDDMDAPVISIDPDAPAYVIYTSGSTGQPKGVRIPHKALQNLVHWHNTTFHITAADRCTQVAGISFDASVWEIWPVLSAGASLYIVDKKYLLDPVALQQQTIIQQISSCFWPTPLAEVMFRLSWPTACTLKQVLIGGDQLRQRPDERLPFTVVDNYGVSEACVVNTSGILHKAGNGVATIGKPIANTCALILDEYRQPVPAGVYGELYLGGTGLSLDGYINREALTAERFVRNPFPELPYDRLYRTGDLAAYTPQGEIRYLGRIDKQVKIRGYRIEIGEVETGLLSLPGISNGAVIVKERADGSNQLIAFVVSDSTMKELRAQLQKKMPAHMIPSMLVPVAALPMTPNGKIDYKALEQLDSTRPEETGPTPAITATEQVLIDLWEEALGISSIGIHDNFFELGGDSITAIQVASRARSVRLSFTSRQLFLYQTIHELAGEVTGSTEQDTVAEHYGALFPLHPIQEWFFSQPTDQFNQFNHTLMLEVPSDTDSTLLYTAFLKLAQQHPVLKLRFEKDATGIRQFYAPATDPANFQVTDLSHSPDNHTELIQNAAAALQGQLDVFKHILYRIVFFQCGPKRPAQLLFVFHHLIMDTFSWRILLKDYYTCYDQLQKGSELQLPSPTTSYQQYIHQLQAMPSDPGQRPLDYWIREAAKPIHDLPIDLEAAANTYGDCAIITAALDAQPTEQLMKQLTRLYKTGVNTMLLATLVKTVGEWIQQTEVHLSIESLGRPEDTVQADLSQTLGWFTAMYPVCLHQEQAASWKDQIIAIKEQLQQVPGDGISYGVGRYLQQQPDLTATPHPHISFNYHGQVSEKQGSSDWRILEGDHGERIAPSFPRQHLLDITCAIENGQLRMNWIFNPNIHHKATIEALADGYMQQLRAMLQAHAGLDQVVYTPSDFPYAACTQAELDSLFKEMTVPVSDIYRLTPMQQGMLFHSLYHQQTSNGYFVQLTLTLQGPLDNPALKQAWEGTLHNNEILRTSFRWKNMEEPVQVVPERIVLPWEETDLSHLSGEAQERYIQDLQQAEEAVGFDFETAPLIRLKLLKTGPEKHYLLWSYHHIIMDGWSLPLVLKEVFGRYFKSAARLPFAPAKRPPFRRFIEWIGRQETGMASAYWQQELAGMEAPTQLQPDRSVSGHAPFLYAEEQVQIDTTTYQQLSRLLKENKVTYNALFQALWSMILGLYTNQETVLFGATVSGRPEGLEGMEDMVGLFINTVPVTVQLPLDTAFFDWVYTLQNRQAEREQYSYLPLVEIHRLSQFRQDTSLFDHILIVENYPSAQETTSDHSLKIGVSNAYERIEMPLSIIVSANDALTIKLSYNGQLYTPALIQRLIGHFSIAIDSLLAGKRLVQEVQLHSAIDIDRLLNKLNPAPIAYPNETVVGLFETSVRQYGQQVAVVTDLESITYEALQERVDQLAGYIRSQVQARNQSVALLMDRSADMLVALLAVMKAGHAYIPLDPAFPQQRLNSMLAAAQPALILLHTQEEIQLEMFDCPVIYYKDIPQAPVAIPSLLAPQADQAAYIIYTSGSTGQPKGVEIGHAALANLLYAFRDQLQANKTDRLLALTTISFDIAALELFLPLISGAQVYIATKEEARDPHLLQQTMAAFRPTIMQATPSTWKMLLDAQWQGDNHMVLLTGGEALPADLALQLRDRCHKLINVYGPTETTIWSSCHELDETDTFVKPYISIGQPIANTTFYVLNKRRQLMPMGAAGELYIGGKGLANGYYNNETATAQQFITHTFENGRTERIYKTGDLVRQEANGQLEFIGRLDNQVKIRGYRIELGDIEAALVQLPGVLEAVVVAKKEPGIQEAYLVAFLKTIDTAIIDAGSLKSSLQALLPHYMIPARFAVLEQWPLTLNHKIDRKALAAMDTGNAVPGAAYKSSRTMIELELVQLWETVLNRAPIGIRENFFELGGHSILAIRLMDRIQQQFGTRYPIASLFQHPTIEELAGMMRQGQEPCWQTLVPMKKTGHKTPVFLIPGEGGNVIYFSTLLRHLDDGHPVYGLQAKGLDGIATPAESVEELADFYIQAIRTACPNGPYIFVGHSMGGNVAYEMAARLGAEDVHVPHVFILDTLAPPTANDLQPEDVRTEAGWLAITAQRIGRVHRSPVALSEEQLEGKPFDQQIDLFKEVLVAAGILPDYISHPHLAGLCRTLIAHQKMRYAPVGKLKQDIVLFKANDNDFEEEPDLDIYQRNTLALPDYGWERLTTGMVIRETVPGNHDTILQQPYVALLGDKINEILTRG